MTFRTILNRDHTAAYFFWDPRLKPIINSGSRYGLKCYAPLDNKWRKSVRIAVKSFGGILRLGQGEKTEPSPQGIKNSAVKRLIAHSHWQLTMLKGIPRRFRGSVPEGSKI